jgi:hypothetical protein
MSTLEDTYINATEGHCLEDIRKVLDAGLAPQARIRGRSLVNWLTEMYSRSDRFPDCLRLLLERGATLDDPIIGPVLLNDADAVKAAVRADPSVLHHRTTLVSTFTPLTGASLLHVAAEYGNLNAARVLVELGAEVDARAACDEFGLNGHTPLFHTVNSNDNRSEPIMRLLLDAGARTDLHLRGITWGKGFEWETTCFDVTPISYAQMGLLPQFHRREPDIYANIKRLVEASRRTVPPLENIPNRYLYSKGKVE